MTTPKQAAKQPSTPATKAKAAAAPAKPKPTSARTTAPGTTAPSAAPKAGQVAPAKAKTDTQPKPAPAKAKTDTQPKPAPAKKAGLSVDRKRELARQIVLAAGSLPGLTAEERRWLSAQLHYLPLGGVWPTDSKLPRPARSDWR